MWAWTGFCCMHSCAALSHRRYLVYNMPWGQDVCLYGHSLSTESQDLQQLQHLPDILPTEGTQAAHTSSAASIHYST